MSDQERESVHTFDGAAIVFAIASGEYSDYHVSCLFERRADAEATAERMNNGDSEGYGAAKVEEFKFYRAGTAPRPVTVYGRAVQITRDLATGDEREWSYPTWSYDEEIQAEPTLVFLSPAERGRGEFRVTGADREAVDAAFSEHLGRLLNDDQYRRLLDARRRNG